MLGFPQKKQAQIYTINSGCQTAINHFDENTNISAKLIVGNIRARFPARVVTNEAICCVVYYMAHRDPLYY